MRSDFGNRDNVEYEKNERTEEKGEEEEEEEEEEEDLAMSHDFAVLTN